MSEKLTVTIATPFDVHQIMDGSMMACEENGFVRVRPGLISRRGLVIPRQIVLPRLMMSA